MPLQSCFAPFHHVAPKCTLLMGQEVGQRGEKARWLAHYTNFLLGSLRPPSILAATATEAISIFRSAKTAVADGCSCSGTAAEFARKGSDPPETLHSPGLASWLPQRELF